MKLVIGIPVILVSTSLLFIYLAFIWWPDRYEREPFWLVGLVFLWGATIGVGCGCGANTAIGASFQQVLSPTSAKGLSMVVVAPVIEELTKGLVFVPLLLTDHFDNQTDGLIYGAAVGLGFAMVENFIYFGGFVNNAAMSTGGMVASMTMRTLFTAVMHCIASSLLGMAIGWARHRDTPGKWLIFPTVGYGLAVVSHAMWNGAAVLSGFYHPGFQLVGIALVVVAGAMLFGLTQYSLKREHDVIRKYLRQEAERGTIPTEHAEIIPYWTKRRRDAWLPQRVPKDAYVEAATLLAFRHHQLEIAPDEKRSEYAADIENFREQVRTYLAGEQPA